MYSFHNMKKNDYSEIYRLAEGQSVIGIVAAGLEHITDEKVPQVWALRFAGQTIQLEQRNKAMNQFLADMVAKMREVSIYTLLVKGQGVAQCYERPLWRACGDVDLFLSDDNYKKAKDYLVPLAISVGEEFDYNKHLALNIEGWEVELHDNLCSGLWRGAGSYNKRNTR